MGGVGVTNHRLQWQIVWRELRLVSGTGEEWRISRWRSGAKNIHSVSTVGIDQTACRRRYCLFLTRWATNIGLKLGQDMLRHNKRILTLWRERIGIWRPAFRYSS